MRHVDAKKKLCNPTAIYLLYNRNPKQTKKKQLFKLKLNLIHLYPLSREMANQELIQKYLDKSLWTVAAEYVIPEQFIEKKTALVGLVLLSRSIATQDDKQSWFNLFPVMTDEQITKLEDILTREKQKLDEIEKKYEEKKIEIKKKYLMKRQQMGYVKKVSDIKAQEAATDATEDKEAEALLDQI